MKPVDHHGPTPVPPALARVATGDDHDLVRAARGCPTDDVLCGAVDGTLWQVARPLARSVAQHCRDCALCQFDCLEWRRSLTFREVTVALWRRVPLRGKAVLGLLCLALALTSLRVHAVNRSLNWLECPLSGRYYLVGGQYDNHREALHYAGRQRAHLAVIRTAAEQAWLREKRTRPDERFLIGLREVGQRGNWQWVTGEPLTYTNWAPGEPARARDDRLRVAVLRNGQWYALAVPEELGEDPVRFAILERRSDPRSPWEPLRCQAIGWLVLSALLVLHAAAVLVERRLVAVRLHVEWRG